VLAHLGWLIEGPESTFLKEVNQDWTLPPGSAVLYGFYTDPRFRGRGLYSSSLARMIGDAREIPGMGDVYICVLADKGRRAESSRSSASSTSGASTSRQFARVRRWSAVADGSAPARA
jgi:hypothetical protein